MANKNQTEFEEIYYMDDERVVWIVWKVELIRITSIKMAADFFFAPMFQCNLLSVSILIILFCVRMHATF